MAKRLSIYATFDKQQRIDGYVVYCLQKLKMVSDTIIVVSNTSLSETEKSKLSMVDQIYERDDSGYDMGGFAYVIQKLNVNNDMCKYDEIIFMNDSVFGPFYSFEEMFKEMDKRNGLDFWGITERGKSDFDGGDVVYPEHIQLYFYVVKSRMLHSKDFMGFWGTVGEKVTDFRSAILNYEFAFTDYFVKRGYIWDVYCKTDSYTTDNIKLNLSPYHYCTYNLIKEQRCPLLKRKLFIGDFIEERYTDKSDLRKAMEYIEHNTKYDIRLILDHLIRVYPIEKIMNALQMTEYYEDEADCDKGNDIKIKLVTSNNIKKQLNIEENNDSEYTLFVSIDDKNVPDILSQSELNNVIENLCNPKVIELFEKKPWLGMVVPPLSTFGKVSKSLKRQWIDQSIVEKLSKKYAISVPIDKYAPIPKIYGFICRTSILSKALLDDLNNDKTGTVLQMLPIIAQQKRYYTETVVNTCYAATLYTNMLEMIYNVYNMYELNVQSDSDIEEIKDYVYKRQIKDFVSQNKNIYVYGAGQLACRALRILENICKPEGIIVSDKNGNADNICGYPVYQASDIILKNKTLVVAVGEKNNKIIEDYLQKMEVKDYLLLK